MALPGLTIGQAAKATGVSRKAVRVYEARTLGLHLDDIHAVLTIRNGGVLPCATVRDLLDDRIAEIDATITELLALRKTLTKTRRRADTRTDDAPVTVCAIIEGGRPGRAVVGRGRRRV